MEKYTLTLNITLKSGVEKKYEANTPEPLTKDEAEAGAKQFKDMIETIYKNDVLGSVTIKSNDGMEVLINTKEIALVEFVIKEVIF